MNFIKQISVLFLISCLSIGVSYAQEPTESDYTETTTESAAESEEEYDAETAILDPETDNAQQSVDIVNNIIDIVSEFEDSDSLIFRFAIYNNDSAIAEYDESDQNSVSQKFDVIKAKDNEDYDFTFIRQTLYNENRQAWDFIYERVYNHEGNLIFFVRRYNTYNSGCAEVAFERSEYYYDERGVLSKKTYELFDSNNNALDYDNCWMERENYNQYKTYSEFISKYPLPL
ncbi:MAG: hypothetical protein J6P44_04300 [Bacteroidales bacterium]|nr:hypothetical protein [Bacteroidales bacterium]